jgi:hypothetical protein
MSNRNHNINQNIENLLFNYLLNTIDTSSTTGARNSGAGQETSRSNTNPLTDRNINSLIRVFDSYQRNIEMYNRNMSELIYLLRTNMNTSRNSPTISTQAHEPNQRSNRRETRFRPWYFSSASTQHTVDVSNNAIPPETTRTPTYSNAGATTITSLNNTETTRTPTYASGAVSNPTINREIERNVSTITYSSEETETRCPISLEDFLIGESICKINNCGHIFKRDALYIWFNNHTTCPVCRANVLPTTTTNNTQSNILNEYSNYIAYTLLAGLNTNPSNIQTYTFNLPLYYDTSGNIGENYSSLNAGSSNISNNYDYIVEEDED